jgi:hypothetical protein
LVDAQASREQVIDIRLWRIGWRWRRSRRRWLRRRRVGGIVSIEGGDDIMSGQEFGASAEDVAPLRSYVETMDLSDEGVSVPGA